MSAEPLDVLAKVDIGKKKKEEGDEAFKKGDTNAGQLFRCRSRVVELISLFPIALRAYHEACTSLAVASPS